MGTVAAPTSERTDIGSAKPFMIRPPAGSNVAGRSLGGLLGEST